MKYIFFLFVTVFIFSCNSGDKTSEDNAVKDSASAQTDPAAQEAIMKSALQQYPDSTPILQNLLGYYLSAGKYDVAETTVDAAIKRDSLNPLLWDMRSVVYLLKADTATGLAALEKAVDIFPTPEYVISLGALYAQLKNPKALEIGDALLVGNKAKAEKEAYFIKGLYYKNSNQPDKAIALFDKSLSIDFHFMDAYMQKSLVLYDLGKYNEAITVLHKAVALENNFAEGYFHLGQCYEKLNDKQHAIEEYRKAVLYDPNYEEAVEALNSLQ